MTAAVVDPLLYVHATSHNALEQHRIASAHRLRALTNTEPDEDGVIRGYGLPETHPDVASVKALTEALAELEHKAGLQLQRSLRKCSIHPWVKQQRGLGEKQMARLLAATGDPYWNDRDNRPRTVSQLWAYCGLHVLPAPTGGFSLPDDDDDDLDHPAEPGSGQAARRRKGQQSNWSTDAKTRAYLCATSCIKHTASPYRATYDNRRAHTATTHPEWTPGHSHNDALRIVSKAILRDLWREAKRLHETTDQPTEAQ